MAGDGDQAAQIGQLQALAEKQRSSIKVLQQALHESDTNAVMRVWGVVLLAGLFATTMGTWLVLPVFTTSGSYSTFDSTRDYGLWDVFGSPNETVGGQAGVTIALLFVLFGAGMAALTAPTERGLYLAAVGAVLLFASEVWLRVGISGQVAAVVEGGADSGGGVSSGNAYAYGGPALTLALILTAAIAVSAFSQAPQLRGRAR